MDWNLSPANQKKYDEVAANIRRLQAELDIKPMSLDERAAEHERKKAEQAKLQALIGKKRPPPKWKV